MKSISENIMKEQSKRLQMEITEEGKWFVAKDMLSGVVSQGTTVEEAIRNLEEAVELYNEN